MSRHKFVRIRLEAFRRQKGRCYYCRVLMWINDCVVFAGSFGISPKVASWLQCTAEHLQAQRDGGTNAASNIVAACRHCNVRRHTRNGDMPPAEYRAHVRRRVSRAKWHDPQVFKSGLVPR